jgi:hypothetical protein
MTVVVQDVLPIAQVVAAVARPLSGEGGIGIQ